LKRLKEKVDGGADYGYPNVFLNAKYFDFVAKAREIGITVLIPGIKPLAVHRHLQILPQIFRIDLPDLIDAVDKCKTNADVKQVGSNGLFKQSRIKGCWSSCFCIIFEVSRKISVKLRVNF
jgi:methylenetetrahydrofolate reductase (NADPH)